MLITARFGSLATHMAHLTLTHLLRVTPCGESGRSPSGGGAVVKQSPKQLLAEVAGAAYCRHPLRLYGETVNTVTGELRSQQLHAPCKDRRAAVCPAAATSTRRTPGSCSRPGW
jgi:hypothetical protein